MQIRITTRRKQGRISLMAGSREEAGYLLFSIEDRYHLCAYSTQVQPSYQGRGLAVRLVEALRDYCTEHRYILRPECSYVAKLTERDPSLARLLDDQPDYSAELIDILKENASEERTKILQWFFKTAPGQYGHGDIFLGIDAPTMRKLYKQVLPINTATMTALWRSPLHEVRSLGYQALVDKALRAESDAERTRLYSLYIGQSAGCNNWDLVDTTAPTMLSIYYRVHGLEACLSEMLRLAETGDLWLQRIAIVGTLGLIREGEATPTIRLAEKLIDHPHDLIHKAIGWMLREMGKRLGEGLLTDWLDGYATRLPRTALRYALERLSPELRSHYMKLQP